MIDYDVWLIHEYFSIYFCFHADNPHEAFKLIHMRLEEEGLPKWFITKAQDIKIEEMGVMK